MATQAAPDLALMDDIVTQAMLAANDTRTTLLPSSGPRSSLPREEHYRAEREYFDQEAEERARSVGPLDPLVVERFASKLARRRRFNKEFRLRMLGSLEGKRVLEIGCGDGEQAVLLAKLGANVTGVDISPKSIELARERARLEGVADKTHFVCSPLHEAKLPDAVFDVVWGDGILHHLIDELEPVMQKVVQWSKNGAVVVFAEPVNMSPMLHKLRMLVPIAPEGTPDERPLEPADLARVHRYLPSMRARPFLFFARVTKLVMGESYERAARWRRWLVSALCAMDYAVLSLPFMRRFAGTLVMIGRVAKT